MNQLSLKIDRRQVADIFVGKSLQQETAQYIRQLAASSVIYITRESLESLLREYLKPNQEDVLTFPSGENQKSLASVTQIVKFLLAKKADKNALIVSFGGGSTSDLVGFAAAVYKRGIKVIYIPTTLLAMVDASIGGKNGVNFEGTKNLLGAIYSPQAIFVDTDLMKGLPRQEFLSGLGELAKIAICLDRKLFDLLQQPFDENMEAIILRGIENKLRQVKMDPYDNSADRQMLNFGHSLGHALESVSGFRLRHGLAVAIGCNFASFISKQRGYITESEYQKIVRFIEKLGLPRSTDFEVKPTMKFMKLDKKKLDSDSLNFVLIQSIGGGIVEPLSFAEIEHYLVHFRSQNP
jgi:3-dehydroquinate synthase